MATTILETLGTLRLDGTLEPDEKPAVPPGRVKVRVESVKPTVAPTESIVEFVERTRRELQAAGHKFMNDNEVGALIEELRADDDRIEEVYRQMGKESQQSQQQ